jgi:hypothetical protein
MVPLAAFTWFDPEMVVEDVDVVVAAAVVVVAVVDEATAEKPSFGPELLPPTTAAAADVSVGMEDCKKSKHKIVVGSNPREGIRIYDLQCC